MMQASPGAAATGKIRLEKTGQKHPKSNPKQRILFDFRPKNGRFRRICFASYSPHAFCKLQILKCIFARYPQKADDLGIFLLFSGHFGLSPSPTTHRCFRSER
jgi:hypothetical protein